MNSTKAPSSPATSVIQRQWTAEQIDAIRSTGCSLLVSAAAGSGKTSVLAERCAYLVCDAPVPCSVTDLLVVTFTEAAAAEMKLRIDKALRERAAADDDPRIRKQLKLVDHASVSTLHGFCLRILRQHFHRLGLDPNVRVIDEDEATLLRADVVRNLFLEKYEAGDDAFTRFIDDYGNGADDNLMSLVLRTHDLMDSIVDPAQWRAEARRRIEEAASKQLNDSTLGQAFLDLIRESIESLKQSCTAAAKEIPPDFPKYTQLLRDLYKTAATWKLVLDRKGYDALAAEIAAFSSPRAPGYANALPGKDKAFAALSVAKEQFSKGALSQWLRFTTAQWQAGMSAIAAPSAVFLNLVSEFGSRYTAAKHDLRGLDFADLERLALQVLRDPTKPGLAPSSAARRYHEQFKHVLVDEYQDINEVQDAILHLVSRECLAGEINRDAASFSSVVSNLFCVGDVKQSIYRFRLAEPGRFLEREQKFRTASTTNRGRVIDLRSNFRSRAPLLGAINSVFERLMTETAAEIEYDDRHHLRPGLTYPGDVQAQSFNGAPIELHLLPTKDHAAHNDDPDADELERSEIEAMLVARRIRQITGADGSVPMHVLKNGTLSPISFADIVILLRAPRYKAGQFADILRASKIPVHTDKGTGYFQAIEVQDMLALLKLLDNQQQDVPMAAVLRSPLAALASADDAMARVRIAYPQDLFHRAVSRYAEEKDDEIAAHLKGFLHQLSIWRDLAHKRPLAELIWTIYDSTGYLAFCQGLEGGPQRYANLLHLHERAKQFGTFSRQGLYRFLRFLDNLQDETETARPTVASESEDVVRIMSIHGSKGLEFPVVFVPDLGKKHNLQDMSGNILVDRKEYLGLLAVDQHKKIKYPTLAHVLVQERIRRQSLAEELRLLYVAMTRAREHLVLVGTCDADLPQTWHQRWQNHAGPIPADTVLAGGCVLDWLGPVSAMTSSAIEIQQWTQEEVATWSADDIRSVELTDFQKRLAHLELLIPPPSPAAARETIERFSYVYPHAPLTRIAASVSVTQWTKNARPEPVSQEQPHFRQRSFDSALPAPRFLSRAKSASAVEIGSTTHLVLQYLDFSCPCDELDLADQINSLVSRSILTAAEARFIDINAMVWLIESKVGRLLRDHFPRLQREVPFYAAAPPSVFDSRAAGAASALDQVMLRGRMDVVIPASAEAGAIIIDYKTDRVTADEVDARAAFYAEQVRLYRESLEKITSAPIAAVYLVFLSPKQFREL